MNTLSQILAVFVTISAILALTNYDTPIVWRSDSELKYSKPKIPADFNDNNRKPPRIIIGNWGAEHYYLENGSQLYRQCHEEGWLMCRKRFYGGTEETWMRCNWDDIYELDPNIWSADHVLAARKDGFDECKMAIDRMLQDSRFAAVKNTIGYNVLWHLIPLWLLIGVSVWITWKLRPKKSDSVTLKPSASDSVIP